MRTRGLAAGVVAVAALACACACACACTRPIDLAAKPDDQEASEGDAGHPKNSGVTAPGPTCSKGTQLLLVGPGNTLFDFDPVTQASKALGALTCPEIEGATIVSGALGADGEAYYL